jgi:simple sugar transport system substrate-binding protein/ribose transport system substrate-binding protein
MAKIRAANVFLLFLVLGSIAAFMFLTRMPADAEGIKYLIGMSQCNLGEPWRIQMNKDILEAAEGRGDIKIVFTDAAQDNGKQIEDVKKLMRLGVDLLIISPNEMEPLTPIIAETYGKIPVIVLDRKVKGDGYTLFIGADNRVIGAGAGKYIGELLGEGGGNVVEIMGLLGSTPTAERSEGFRDAIAGYPGVSIAGAITADWLRDAAEDGFGAFLAENGDLEIDAVYAHNDPMAFGAYKAALAAGREKDMAFVGIDGLDGEEGGISLVRDGILDITFIYPTGGKEAVDYATRILDGERFEDKQVVLDSVEIAGANRMGRFGG